MEILILISALGLAVVIAVLKNFQFAPSELSEFELARRADEGDGTAAYELYRRPLLPTLAGLRSFKVVLLTSALATLLVATHDWWLGLALLLGIWLATELVANKGWLTRTSHAVQRVVEPRIIQVAKHASAVMRHFAPHHAGAQTAAVSSRHELLHLINHDTQFLTTAEKTRVQAALAFGDLKIADVMVPRDKIATVDVKETVGPVLLDRLHKDGHQIFVAVKKDLDDIKGLLYMSDATSGHPEIKTVKDAVRPTVHYIAQNEPLESVLAASLQSGRQLFIVVDDHGNTTGLISLRDALTKLLGTAPPTETRLSTDKSKVNE